MKTLYSNSEIWLLPPSSFPGEAKGAYRLRPPARTKVLLSLCPSLLSRCDQPLHGHPLGQQAKCHAWPLCSEHSSTMVITQFQLKWGCPTVGRLSSCPHTLLALHLVSREKQRPGERGGVPSQQLRRCSLCQSSRKQNSCFSLFKDLGEPAQMTVNF